MSISPRILNAIATGIGAALGYLLMDYFTLLAAEKRSLTKADQAWMAATHIKEKPDG